MNFTITDINIFKHKALQWATRFDVLCYLDSNNFSDPYSKYDLIIAAGAKHELKANVGNAFAELEAFRQQHQEWLMGFFTYDLKNEIETLSSSNPDHLHLPDLYFFVPEYLITVKDNNVSITGQNSSGVLYEIEKQKITQPQSIPTVKLQPRFNKADYIATVKKIQDHIIRGDIYVSNFCQEFFANGVKIDPLEVFKQLNQLSPTPFSCYFKYYQQHILCASPERFLAKRGSKLISQPIKGTAKRQENTEQDELVKNALQNDQKERQENVMIVDLVRNDLTHSAKAGTVKTEELFGIYSFNQVHQMISTVICELRNDVSEVQAIKNTFPMGSMTGAPKISSMQLMEQYEKSKRGVYSGAIGYFSPDNDFDYNVVIRTLLYNQENKYLSLHVGSAITYDADAEKEYEECLVKASAMFKVLGH
ncbi:anthranilate synthase component I family protein [Mucilaginibacter boryungensis]|uniref:anthranilate synthase component I family protein n=1 Tax=Mucilaginibacter boryungensis TaxID=768480 RepID=UPI00293BAE6B|nr:anthranilate synthase component I family protein [Mucilaginibacter boryungensis]